MYAPVSILSTFIYNFTKFEPTKTVSNSIELTMKLSSLQLNNSVIMVLFDVSSHFTSIPQSETFPLDSDLLSKSQVNTSIKTDILAILKLCLSKNFFIFNNKYCSQPESLDFP